MSEPRICPNCGASVQSDVCEYCGTALPDPAQGEEAGEYPTVWCKTARLSLIEGAFLTLVPAVSFVFTYFWLVDVMYDLVLLIPALFCFSIGFFFSVKLFKRLKAIWSVKHKGTDMEGIVYGYMNDNVTYNDEPCKIIQVLTTTSEGKKFVLIPLSSTHMPYPVGSKVTVRAYDVYAKVKKME